MKKNRKGYTIKELLIVLPLILVALSVVIAIPGWIMNAIKLTRCDFKEPYKAEIIRTVCIFVEPLGGVVGFMDIGQ